MKSGIEAAFLFVLVSATVGISARATPIIFVDFASLSTLLQGTGTAARMLGDTGPYSFGTWIYSAVGNARAKR